MRDAGMRCLALLLSLLAASSAFAEQALVWRTVGNWNAAIDPSYGNTCFITTSYQNGTAIRLGFNPKDSALPVYLMVGNEDWASIEDEKDYKIRFQLDSETPWDATASGITMGNFKALVISFGEAKFVSEFVRKHWFKAWFNDQMIANLSLSGSAKAAKELAVCQSTVNSYLSSSQNPSSKDPFDQTPTGNKRNAKDPFSM